MRTIVCALFVWAVLVTCAEARKVTVAVPVLDVTQSALFVARDRGFFQKEGLEVDLILMRGGVANQALIAGNVEFTTVPTAGLQAALQGAPLKVVLSTFHKPMFWLYSRPEIRSVKELHNKKVAVSSLGAAGDSALRELIKKNGMDENRDVAILAIGTTATRLGALSAGVVDAAMMTFPHNITAAESGFRELVSFIASDIIQLQGAIVTREALLNTEPGSRGKISARDDQGNHLLFDQPERRHSNSRARCQDAGEPCGEDLRSGQAGAHAGKHSE